MLSAPLYPLRPSQAIPCSWALGLPRFNVLTLSSRGDGAGALSSTRPKSNEVRPAAGARPGGDCARSTISGAYPCPAHEVMSRIPIVRRTRLISKARGGARLTESGPGFLVSPFSRREQVQLTGLVLLWACTVILLFSWWFQRDHVVNGPNFAIASLALAWVVCLPAYFFFFLLRARVPNPGLAIGSNWRVAMVVTKAPSEPFCVVQATLLGMLSQSLSSRHLDCR